MKYLTQAEHKEYIQRLKEEGFNHVETNVLLPGDSPYGKDKKMLSNVPDDVLSLFRGAGK